MLDFITNTMAQQYQHPMQNENTYRADGGIDSKSESEYFRHLASVMVAFNVANHKLIIFTQRGIYEFSKKKKGWRNKKVA